ncbi:MAG: uroporphyrinogen decarboxylase family protein [Verrucomicrobiota bacterium]
MNSLERILATLAGQPVDRRPFSLTLCLYGARLTGCPLPEYYSNPTAYALGQAAVAERFAPDILFGPFALAAVAEAFGAETRWFPEHPPILKRPAATSVAEALKLPLPDPSGHPRLTYLRETTRQMAAQSAGTVPIAGVLTCLTDFPALLVGFEAWMECLLFAPEQARELMARLNPWFIELANGLLEAGAAFVAMPAVFISPAMLPRGTVTGVTLPALREAMAGIRGAVVLHHAGGPFLSHLDLLPGLPHLAAMVVDHTDDLGLCRAALGPEPTLIGGMDGPNLGTLSAAGAAVQARAALENRRADARFILGSTGPDVPYDTPPENLLAVRRAVEEFGGTQT